MPQSIQVAELSVAIRWRLAAEPLVIGTQSIARRPQQTPQHVGTGPLCELPGQLPQAATDPFRRVSGGRTRRFRFAGPQQIGLQHGTFFRRTVARRPAITRDPSDAPPSLATTPREGVHVQAGELRQAHVSAKANPLSLVRDEPTPLLLIHPAQ